MVTERRFAQFLRGIAPPRMGEIPEGGLCLSVFLVISRRRDPNYVLMGRLSSDAPWDHIGALDSERVERHRKGWMLPSSHLVLGEGPKEAAERVLKEQLGLTDQTVTGPLMFSRFLVPRTIGISNSFTRAKEMKLRLMKRGAN